MPRPDWLPLRYVKNAARFLSFQTMWCKLVWLTGQQSATSHQQKPALRSEALPGVCVVTSSPTCYRDGFKESWRGELVEYDAAAAKDVAVWRKAQRQRLLAWRQALPNEQRLADANDVCAQLFDRIRPTNEHVISTYWPFKGEMDLRPFMRAAIEFGATIALPVVETRNAPLAFRRWTPETQMERGIWGYIAANGRNACCAKCGYRTVGGGVRR